MSKINSWTDYSKSATRAPGEGEVYNLDGTAVAFVPQEDKMYISAGRSFWYETKSTLSSDLTKETITVTKLKTASNQGALSQEAVTKDKNNVIFISNEPVLTTLGRVSGVIATPMMGDLSYPIINDLNSYDLTDCVCKYHKNYLYFSVPKAQLIRRYNQTNPNKQYWEAPITYSIACFSEINGDLYGHSYNTPETYKLFDGYNFNGAPIPALAVFSYMNFGTRARSKGFNQFYCEGYATQNTTFTFGIKKEINGCATSNEFQFDCDNKPPYVCVGGSTAPLGKEAIGSNPLGGELAESTGLPPKFRFIKTPAINPYFYEVQFSFWTNDVDNRWEILAFGPNILENSDLNNAIKI